MTVPHHGGQLTVAACTCPKNRHTCPHCGQYDEQIALHFFHIDRCHRKNTGSAAKSIPPNASHEASRLVL